LLGIPTKLKVHNKDDLKVKKLGDEVEKILENLGSPPHPLIKLSE
jgi:hypothetical protein